MHTIENLEIGSFIAGKFARIVRIPCTNSAYSTVSSIEWHPMKLTMSMIYHRSTDKSNVNIMLKLLVEI